MIRKCLKKAAALAAALTMALMFIPAGAYAVYAADWVQTTKQYTDHTRCGQQFAGYLFGCN